MAKVVEIEKKAEITGVRVVSRLSTQLNDRTWYAFESERTATLSGYTDDEVKEFAEKLWDTVNDDVDNQLAQAVDANTK